MTTKPTAPLGWAETDVSETVSINGIPTEVDNNIEPSQGLKDTGWLARQQVERSNLNWKLREIDRWIEYFNTNGITEYQATADYAVSAIIRGSDGVVYKAAIANGPSSIVVDPVGDSTGTWGPAFAGADLLDGQPGSFYRNASNLNAGTVPQLRLDPDVVLTVLNLASGLVDTARLPAASETTRGTSEEATQAETDAGTAGTLYVPPDKLLNGFDINVSGAHKHVKLPSWLGGLIINFGRLTSVTDGSFITANFSEPFTAGASEITILITANLASGNNDANFGVAYPISNTQFEYRLHNLTDGTASDLSYIAIGT